MEITDIFDFEEARLSADGVYRFSNSVLSPVLHIGVSGDGFQCTLLGKRVIRGEARLIKAESLEHNLVEDDGVVRPLPAELPNLMRSILKLSSGETPSFKKVAEIARGNYDWIDVEIAPSVWASVESLDNIEIRPISGLQADLYPYQSLGVMWMRQTLLLRGGLVLADEMGLGKTLQLIALLLLFKEESPTRVLIICPTSLIINWQREIYRFAPNLSVLIHRGANRAGIVDRLSGVDIILTTYDTVVQDVLFLQSIPFEWIICDEAQAVKNPDSKRRKALSALKSTFFVPVTGTPVETSLTDLWSLVDLSIPGLLGSRAEFEVTYQNDPDSARELTRYVDALILRRRLTDVASDLPERHDISLPVELSPRHALLYEEVRSQALEEFEGSGALVASGRLELLTAHPWILDYPPGHEFWQSIPPETLEEYGEGMTPKLEATLRLIQEAFSTDKKILLFARYNRVFPIINALVSGQDDVYVNQINGGTDANDRQVIVDEFSEHNGPALLILNPKAAGSGLNITAATVVIHYTQYWNPALDMQASARAHRRGQTQPVTVYRVFYVNTIEEVMLERAAYRRELGDTILEEAGVDNSDIERALKLSPLQGGN